MAGQKQESFQIRSLARAVYLPNLLFSIGQGAAIPMIALLALDLGSSAATAGAIVALRGIGMMLFDVPAGVLVARIGDRRAMAIASVALALIAAGIAVSESLPVYAVLVVLMGCTWSVWTLARVAYAAEASPLGHRGRVMSMMGGMSRIGLFTGPMLGGLLVIPMGLAGPFILQAVLAGAAAATLFWAPELDFEAEPPDRSDPHSLVAILRTHRRVLGTAGVVAVAIQVLRSSRQAIIPLWGDGIGVGASEISLIFAASTLMEILVFYPVGILMDRKGRKWAAVPLLSLLSVGIAAIPLSSDLVSLAAVGLVIGFANGLGSGINMTLGSDLSPVAGRSQFLGVWRLVTDVGTAGGPLVVAAVTSIASLGAAAVAVAGVGVAGLVVLLLAVPETLRQQA